MTPRRFFLAALLCAAAATLFFIYTQRGQGDILTEERLAEARARWQENGPADYDMSVNVRGVQKNDYEIEVRGGKVTKMTAGGAPAARNAYAYWNVEGMLDFLRDELSNTRRVAAAYGVADEAEVVVRVEFDTGRGYPSRFLRHVMGTRNSIEWEITSFNAR